MAIEIDSMSGLSVPDAGLGNRPRFATIFRAVWNSIPQQDRERILAYWRKFRGAPSIDMVSRFKLPRENDDYRCIVRFNAEAADWMPDDKLAAHIAYELGHVWRYNNPASDSNTRQTSIEVLTPIKE